MESDSRADILLRTESGLVRKRTREAAGIILGDDNLKKPMILKLYLEKLSNMRTVTPKDNPMVSVEYWIDDDNDTLKIKEIIPLRTYLIRTFLGYSVGINRSWHSGSWTQDTKWQEWEVEWVMEEDPELKADYWTLDDVRGDCDKIRIVDAYMKQHGPFDPENEFPPQSNQIKEYVESLKK